MLRGEAPQGRRHLREAAVETRKENIRSKEWGWWVSKEWGLGAELFNQRGEARTWTAAAQCGERRREVLVEIGRRDPHRHRRCWVSGGGAGAAGGGKWVRIRRAQLEGWYFTAPHFFLSLSLIAT
jgi:hypothetical protein